MRLDEEKNEKVSRLTVWIFVSMACGVAGAGVASNYFEIGPFVDKAWLALLVLVSVTASSRIRRLEAQLRECRSRLRQLDAD